jgi:hypothetical protein
VGGGRAGAGAAGGRGRHEAVHQWSGAWQGMGVLIVMVCRGTMVIIEGVARGALGISLAVELEMQRNGC